MATKTYNDIYEALLAAQAEFPDIKKTETADTGRFSYNYAALPDVIGALVPVLHKHGIVVTQPTMHTEYGTTLGTRLHHVASGTHIEATALMPAPEDPQAWGSAMTYFRRYCLLSICGVAPDDDDDGQRAQDTYRASAPARSGGQPQDRGHGICPDHGKAWFQTPKMKSPAHPIDGGGWCNKSDVMDAQADARGDAQPQQERTAYQEAQDVLAQLLSSNNTAEVRADYIKAVLKREINHPREITDEEWVKVHQSALEELVAMEEGGE